MSQIKVSNLTFCYDGSYDNIFEDVSFCIDTSWKLGFTGRNGRGKTTFLNLLMGKYEYTGKIICEMDFEYFPYVVNDESKTAIDIAEDIYPMYEYWQLQKEIYQLGLDDEILYREFKTLSGGEKTKILLALLFLKENNFLLIDEPTNHLDTDGREVLAAYLKRKKGFILVSHDRSFLDECTDHTLSINKTNIEVQKGNFSSWYNNWQMKNSFEQKENEKLQKEIGVLTKAAKQSKGWADEIESRKIGKKCHEMYEKNIGTRAYIGEKSRRMQQRRKNLERRQERALDEKSSLLKNVEYQEDLKIMPKEYHKNTLLTFKDLALYYGENEVCSNISFTLEQGQRAALTGSNGCGKSSVLNLICYNNVKYKGLFELGSGVKISYIPQNTGFLKGDLSTYAREEKIDESLFKAILRKLDFSREQFEKDMSDFSQGQKKKVLIAKSLCDNAHLYIWDEPLNFIDVFSRMQIEKLLQASSATILFVEHDKSFTEKISTNVIKIG